MAANSAQAGKSRFGSGFGGMLMGGLLGAGLFGLLSGSGLFSGISGLAGFLGLLLQVALIGGIIYLAVAFFRGRQQPAMAGAGAPSSMMNRSGLQPEPRPASAAGGGFGGAETVATTPLTLAQQDYETFETLLGRIQDAYGREEIGALKAMATPEMVGYFSQEIEGNRRRNVHNLTSDAKLLQGDLAEAWTESGAEYATVAMRYSLIETVVERGTGRVLEGNSSVPTEVTELWTFARRPGSGPSGWELSAIQQTA